MLGGKRPGAGRPKGARNKATVQREAHKAAVLAAALAETPDDALRAMLPLDYLQLATIAAYKAGDVKLCGDLADKWAAYVHPKKTDATIGLTLTDVRRLADLARAEASRRGLDHEAAAGPTAGAVPA